MAEPELSFEQALEQAANSLAEARKTIEELKLVLADYARELREPNDN